MKTCWFLCILNNQRIEDVSLYTSARFSCLYFQWPRCWFTVHHATLNLWEINGNNKQHPDAYWIGFNGSFMKTISKSKYVCEECKTTHIVRSWFTSQCIQQSRQPWRVRLIMKCQVQAQYQKETVPADSHSVEVPEPSETETKQVKDFWLIAFCFKSLTNNKSTYKIYKTVYKQYTHTWYCKTAYSKTFH